MKKVLFFGLGSIGERHAKLLTDHFEMDLAAYRTGDRTNELGIQEFRNLDEAFSFEPDVAFITNPTNLHIETAIECARRSIDLFIEKPLSNTPEGIDQLSELIEQNRLVNHVAFCLRFHPVIKYLKQIVAPEEIFYTRTICSSYLPAWRPGQDYSKSYSADRDRGGGVMNELIHELDYNEHLFGGVEKLSGSYGQASDLNIKADDYSEFQLSHQSGIKSHVSLDYFSHFRERTVKIYTPDKVIVADIINQTVKTYREHELTEEILLDDDNMYLNQLSCFFDAVDNRSAETLCTVSESRNLVEKLSLLKNRP